MGQWASLGGLHDGNQMIREVRAFLRAAKGEAPWSTHLRKYRVTGIPTLKAGKETDMRKLILSPFREQSRCEELANSVSHGIALVAMLIGTPFLIMNAARQGDAGQVFGTSVFSATAILLYLSSAVYHALSPGKAKRVFRIIEHSAIFLLIAGTYTPFTLGILKGTWGWTLFGLVWSLVIAGVALKIFEKKPHPIISTSLYLFMGWLIVLAVNPLLAKVPTEGLLWLLTGGLFYTVGVVFFATDSKLQYGHLIWHLFVMSGTTCHYFAVLWYAA
ncbi:hemolysin III family protein [Neptuniibacter sp. CAU 1671]|uniref:PAQR family membrane homeostasis protein TrhA n=1 Tax=Neptuniibacter sp. CAU 1671 TaxID=3032593 RepID=UPI0023DCC5F7|nr:hemolysin III family protein [Neptuniibacter sp. CAU 1671]MDF2183019.1 hemolysin III family protein [Neptuniibacter sp. CAU 1671]